MAAISFTIVIAVNDVRPSILKSVPSRRGFDAFILAVGGLDGVLGLLPKISNCQGTFNTHIESALKNFQLELKLLVNLKVSGLF